MSGAAPAPHPRPAPTRNDDSMPRLLLFKIPRIIYAFIDTE